MPVKPQSYLDVNERQLSYPGEGKESFADIGQKDGSFLDVDVKQLNHDGEGKASYADTSSTKSYADVSEKSLRLRNPDFLAPSYQAGLDLRTPLSFLPALGITQMFVFTSVFKVSPNGILYMGAGTDPDEEAVLLPTPQCKVHLLQVCLTEPPGAGTVTVTVRKNRTDTDLEVQLSGSGDSASDSVNEVLFAATEKLTIRCVAQNAALTYVTGSLVFEL